MIWKCVLTLCKSENFSQTTKTDRYGLMVPYTFFSFPRQVQCLPGIFVSRPSLSRFRVGEFRVFPSLERPCRGQALSGCGLGNSSVVPEPFVPSGTPECLAKRIRKFRRAQQSQKYFQDGKKNLWLPWRQGQPQEGILQDKRDTCRHHGWGLSRLLSFHPRNQSIRILPQVYGKMVSSLLRMETWWDHCAWSWRPCRSWQGRQRPSDGSEHRRMFLCRSYLSVLCLAGVVLLPPDSTGSGSW